MSQTKEKILCKALNLFVARGIDKTSTNLIAKESEVASGTIFVHFENKQDLVNQVYLAAKNRFFQSLETSIKPKSVFKKNIQNIAADTINHFIIYPKDFYFITSIEPEIDISKEFIKQVDTKLEELKKYLQLGIKEGEIKDVEVNLLFEITWNCLIPIIRHYHQQETAKAKKIHLEMVWDLVKNG
jgi:AcrR family transcriptional regulator